MQVLALGIAALKSRASSSGLLLRASSSLCSAEVILDQRRFGTSTAAPDGDNLRFMHEMRPTAALRRGL